MSEAELQTAVLELAKLRGWLWYHVYDSRRTKPGFPDLVLLHPTTGHLLFVELKTAKGRVSDKQQQWIDALYRGGHAVHVWRPEDLTNGRVTRWLAADKWAVSS